MPDSDTEGRGPDQTINDYTPVQVDTRFGSHLLYSKSLDWNWPWLLATVLAICGKVYVCSPAASLGIQEKVVAAVVLAATSFWTGYKSTTVELTIGNHTISV